MKWETEVVLSKLSKSPKSISLLTRITRLTDKQVRNAIDALRKELCVWLDIGKGFWIDEPVSRSLPKGPNRWKREVDGS
jgi:hypothetical protein